MGCAATKFTADELLASQKTEEMQRGEFLHFEKLVSQKMTTLLPEQRMKDSIAMSVWQTSTVKTCRPKEVLTLINTVGDGYLVMQGLVVADAPRGTPSQPQGIHSLVGFAEMCSGDKAVATIRAGPRGCIVRVFKLDDYLHATQRYNAVLSRSSFKILYGSPLCAGLSESDAVLLHESMDRRDFSPNEKIYAKGSSTLGKEDVFFVESGSVIETEYSNPNQDFTIPGIGIRPNLNPLDGFGLVPEALSRQVLSPARVFGQDALLGTSASSASSPSSSASPPSSSSSTPPPPPVNGLASASNDSQHGGNPNRPKPSQFVLFPGAAPRLSTATASTEGCSCLVLNKAALANLKLIQFQLYRNLFANDAQFVAVVQAQSNEWVKV